MNKLKILFVLFLSCCATNQAPPTITIQPQEDSLVEAAHAAASEKELSKDGIQWYEMNAHAFFKAQREDLVIMLYLRDETCEPCLIFDRATLSDPGIVKKVNREFVPMLVGEEMKQEVEAAFGMSIYPTVIFLRPTGEHLITIRGFVPPSKFKLVLEAITTYLPVAQPSATPIFT